MICPITWSGVTPLQIPTHHIDQEDSDILDISRVSLERR